MHSVAGVRFGKLRTGYEIRSPPALAERFAGTRISQSLFEKSVKSAQSVSHLPLRAVHGSVYAFPVEPGRA